MTFTIRPILPGEVELLAQISRKTFYDTFHEQNTAEDMQLFLDETFGMEILEKELQDKNNHFFFARQGEEIVGYLKLSENKPETLPATSGLEISRIYVTAEYIGKGVGKTLVQFAVDFAKQMNKHTIWLGVWEHNKKAIAFYEKFGFRRFASHIFMVGNDAQSDLLMKRDL